eukprot:gene2369-2730_t
MADKHKQRVCCALLQKRHKVQHVDLIAKELMVHKKCYNDYARILGENESSRDKSEQSERVLGDFTKVETFIEDAVLSNNQAVSISALHAMYGVGCGSEAERVYRNKLKNRIMEGFGPSLKFLNVDGIMPEVVVSSEGLNNTTIINNKALIIRKAAEYLREDVLAHISNCNDRDWPPTVETLTAIEKNIPLSITDFFKSFLKSKENAMSETMKRYANSLGSDLVNALAAGKGMPAELEEKSEMEMTNFARRLKQWNYFRFLGSKDQTMPQFSGWCVSTDHEQFKLEAVSAKYQRPIDFKYALTYPLGPVPLALAHPDGSPRKTVKSQLMEMILSYTDDVLLPEDFTRQRYNTKIYFVDLMALIRTLSGVGSTYEELAFKIFELLPTKYDRIDIVADSYIQNSIKSVERQRRGNSKEVLVKQYKSKLPRNFNDFLQNGNNKTRLIEIIKTVLIEKSAEISASHAASPSHDDSLAASITQLTATVAALAADQKELRAAFTPPHGPAPPQCQSRPPPSSGNFRNNNTGFRVVFVFLVVQKF